MQEVIPLVIEIIRHYGYLVVFVGALVGGETIILAASFLAVLGFLSLPLVIIVSLLGILISDNFWYFLGYKFKRPLSFCRHNFCPDKFQPRVDSLKRQFNQHHRRLVFLSKFIYGARIMMLVFAGHEKMPYRSFFYYNLLANLFWIVLVITLGILMGFSWNFLEQYNYYSRYLVFSGLAILVALRFIFKKFLSFREYEPGN